MPASKTVKAVVIAVETASVLGIAALVTDITIHDLERDATKSTISSTSMKIDSLLRGENTDMLKLIGVQDTNGLSRQQKYDNVRRFAVKRANEINPLAEQNKKARQKAADLLWRKIKDMSAAIALGLMGVVTGIVWANKAEAPKPRATIKDKINQPDTR